MDRICYNHEYFENISRIAGTVTIIKQRNYTISQACCPGKCSSALTNYVSSTVVGNKR